MVQARRGLSLRPETFYEIRRGALPRRHYFHRNDPVDRGLPCPVNNAHAPSRYLLEQFVRAKDTWERGDSSAGSRAFTEETPQTQPFRRVRGNGCATTRAFPNR